MTCVMLDQLLVSDESVMNLCFTPTGLHNESSCE